MENKVLLVSVDSELETTKNIRKYNKGYIDVTVHSPIGASGSCLFDITPMPYKDITLFGSLPEGYVYDTETHLFTAPTGNDTYPATFEGTYELRKLTTGNGIEMMLEELEYCTNLEYLKYDSYINIAKETNIEVLKNCKLGYLNLTGSNSATGLKVVGNIENIVGPNSLFGNYSGTNLIAQSNTNIIGDFVDFVRNMINIANKQTGNVDLSWILVESNCSFNGHHYNGAYTLEWTSTSATLKQGSTVIETVNL